MPYLPPPPPPRPPAYRVVPATSSVAPPARRRGSATKGVVGVLVTALLGYGLYAGVKHGISCQTSVLHPNVKAVDSAVHQQLVVLEKLETGPNSKGWTRAQGEAALAADTTATRTLGSLRLSSGDRVTVDHYLAVVAQFDLRLTSYMAQDTVDNRSLFGVAAKALQNDTQDLSAGLYSIPRRCS